MNVFPALGLAFALAVAAMPAAAQTTVYKLVDRNGRVTYANEPPANFDGQVTRLEIKAGKQTATFQPTAPASPPAGEAQPAKAGEAKPGSVAEAEQKLEAQRRRLQNAKDNPGEGDIVRLGKVGGGTRPEFSDAYKRRLAEIEKDVKAAEEAVERARRGN